MKTLQNTAIFFSFGLIALLLYTGIGHAQSATSTTNTASSTPITGACSVEVFNYNNENATLPGRTIQWMVQAGGGNRTFSYVWTGTDGLYATSSNTIQHTYTTPGSKTATVTVTSGSYTQTFTCGAILPSVDVHSDSQAVGGSCVFTDPTTASLEKDTYWEVSPSGGNGTYTFDWSGDITGTTTVVHTRYTTPGMKTASVLITSQALGDQLTLTCQGIVSQTTPVSGCFIATAAWGTPDQPEVVTLRKFRDEKLLTNQLGSDFVAFYYKTSPPIANVISKSELLKAATRALLQPLVFLAEQDMKNEK